MATVASLVTKLSVHTQPFLKGMRRAGKSSRKFGSVISRVSRRLGGLKTALLSAAGAAGLGMFIKQSFSAIDALSKTASKLGVTTEALSAFHHVAQISGVPIKQFNMALQRMIRRMAEAAVGTGEAKEAIKTLGLDARQLIRVPLQERMGIIADAFARVTNKAEKLRLAFKLFDSEGVVMLNVLEQGSKGMKELAAQAERLGLIVTRDMEGRIVLANDAITSMRAAFRGLSNTIATSVAPMIKKLADRVTGLLVIFRNMSAATKATLVARVKIVAAWVAAGAAILVFRKILLTLVAAYKAVAKAAAIAMSLTGPQGIAIAGAGIAAATASLWAVEKAFASVTRTMKMADVVGADYSKQMAELSAATEKVEAAQTSMARSLKNAASAMKSPIKQAQGLIAELMKKVSEFGLNFQELTLKRLSGLKVPPQFMKLAQALADQLTQLEAKAKAVAEPMATAIKDTVSGRIGGQTPQQLGIGAGGAMPSRFASGNIVLQTQKKQTKLLDSIDKRLGRIEGLGGMGP